MIRAGLCLVLLSFGAVFLCSRLFAQEAGPADRPNPPLTKHDLPEFYPPRSVVLTESEAGEIRSARNSVSREEFEEFLQDSHLNAQAVTAPDLQIKQAKYEAILAGEVLTGRMELTVRHRRDVAGMLHLSPCNLFLKDLRWPDRPVDWGITQDERAALHVQPDDQMLTGSWSLRGRVSLDVMEYDWQGPAAESTEILLTLPEKFVVSATTAAMTAEPLPEVLDGLRVWRLQLGRASRLRFQVVESSTDRDKALTLVSREQSITARSEGVEITCDLELQSPGHSSGMLSTPLPADLTVTSVVLNGEYPIVGQEISREGQRVLRFDIGKSDPGRVRRLRIKAFQSTNWAGRKQIPLIGLTESQLIDDKVTLHVAYPLKLREHRTDSLVLTSVQFATAESETWSFTGTAGEPRLELVVGVPEANAAISLFSSADYSQEIPRFESLLDVVLSQGSLFTLNARVPPHWQVISVSDASVSTEGDIPFDQFPAEDFSGNLLTMRFPEPVAAGQKRSIRIVAAGAPSLISEGGVFPVLSPVGCDVSFHLVGITPPPNTVTVVPPEVREVEKATIPGPLMNTEFSGRIETLYEVTRFNQEDEDLPTLDFESTSESELTGESILAFDRQEDQLSTSPQSPLIDHIEVTSRLSPVGEQSHIHVAQCVLKVPFSGVFLFELHNAGHVLDVKVDGESISVRRTMSGYQSAVPVEIRSDISIWYLSPATRQFISQTETIPIPEWSGSRPSFRWNIGPSSGRTCARIQVPFSHVEKEQLLAWTQKLLGPLGQRSIDDSASSLESEENGSAESQRTTLLEDSFSNSIPGIRVVSAAVAPDKASMVTWNYRDTRGLSWVTLIGSAMIVIGLRLLKSVLLRKAAPVVLIAAAWTSTLIPPIYAEIGGAAFLGLLFGVAAPRRLLSPWGTASFHSPSIGNEATKSLHRALSTGVILVAIALFDNVVVVSQERTNAKISNQNQEGSPSPVVVVKSEDGLADEVFLDSTWYAKFLYWKNGHQNEAETLIRSARYELTDSDPAQVRIEYDILVRPRVDPTRVVFPLNGITFLSAEDCWIDGVQSRFAPVALGTGIAITIPGLPGEKLTESLPPLMEHQVVLQGRMERSVERRTRFIDGQIPKVPESILALKSPGSQQSATVIGASGILESREGTLLVELGPTGRLSAWWPLDNAALPRNDDDSQSVQIETTARVHPLRVQYTTRWEFDSVPILGDLAFAPFVLPQNAVILKVGKSPGLDVLARYQSHSPYLAVHFRPDQQRGKPFVEVDYVVPTPSPKANGSVSVSTIRSIDRPLLQAVSVRPALGYILQDKAIVSIDPSTGFENSSLEPSDRARVASVHDESTTNWNISSQQKIECVVTREQTQRTGVATCTVGLGRQSMDVECEIKVDVSDAPALVHEIAIDPRFQINTASVFQGGAERLEGVVRNPNTLTLILSRPLIGEQRLHMTGTIPLQVGSLESVPRFRIEDCDVLESSYSIQNRSGWPAVAVTGEGVATELKDELDDLSAVTLTGETEIEATRVRVDVGEDAAESITWTRLVPGQEQTWKAVTIGRVRPVDAAIEVVRIHLPEWAADSLQVRPDTTIVSPHPQGGVLVELHPEQLIGGEFRFQVESNCRLPEADSELEWPIIAVMSAKRIQTLLTVDPEFPFRPVSATSESIEDLVEHMATLGIATPRLSYLSDHPSYMIPGLSWIWSQYSLKEGTAEIPLATSQLWLDPDHGVRAQTEMTLVTSGEQSLMLKVPQGTVVESITLDDEDIAFQKLSDTEIEIDLQHRLSGAMLGIHWHRRQWRTNSSTDVPLPRPLGTSVKRNLALALPADRVAVSLDSEISSEAALALQWDGLLEAAESVSSRSLAIDSRLFAGIRSIDAALSDHDAELQLNPDELKSLQARWRQIQQQTSVDASAAGSTSPSVAPMTPEIMRTGEKWKRLEDQQFTLSIESHTSGHSGQTVFILSGIGACLILVWVASTEWLFTVSDWFEERPWLSCLLIGIFWWGLLTPALVGQALCVLSIIQMARQGGRQLQTGVHKAVN